MMDIFDIADRVTAGIVPLGPEDPLPTPAFVSPTGNLVEQGVPLWFNPFPCPHCHGSVLVDTIVISHGDGPFIRTTIDVEAVREY